MITLFVSILLLSLLWRPRQRMGIRSHAEYLDVCEEYQRLRTGYKGASPTLDERLQQMEGQIYRYADENLIKD